MPSSAEPRSPEPTLHQRRWLLATLLGLVALVCALWFVAARGYWEDDAYIHLEFARSLAAGRGFCFNGHVVYGDTSPLWVWLLVAVHAVATRLLPAAGDDWMVAGKLLSVLAAIFALAGCWAFSVAAAARCVSCRALQVFAATMLLVPVTAPYFGYWAFSGMEALAAAGLGCWGLLLVSPAREIAESESGWPMVRLLLAACVAGLAPLLRPEMALLSGLLGVALVREWLGLRRSVAMRGAALGAGVVLLCGPAVGWAIYAVRTFGSVLPNTNAAKRAAPGNSVWLRLLHVYGFGYPTLLLGLGLLLVVAVGWLALRQRWVRDRAAIAMLPAGVWIALIWWALTTVFYVANHTFVQTRYIFAGAPALTIALSAMALRLHRRLYRAAVVGTLAYGVVVSTLSTRPLVRNKVTIDARYAELGAYVRKLPQGSVVAEYSIGEAAFLTQRPLLDTGGITRPDAIPYLLPLNEPGLQAWVRRQGAQYEVMDHSPGTGARQLWAASLPVTGWYYDPRRYREQERIILWALAP